MPEDRRDYPVLFVDDDAAVVAALRYLLPGDEYQLLTAPSGPQALEILATRDVAVLLSDQCMPGMKGTELCAKAREIRPDLVTLVVTAYADIQVVTDAIRRSQVSAYLAKPWVNEQIIEALHAAIGQARMARTARHQNGLEQSSSPALSILRSGPFRVDLVRNRVSVDGTEVHGLGPLEVRLLGYLVQHAGKLNTYAEIQDAVFGLRQPHPGRSQKPAIYRLRRAMGKRYRHLIVNVPGVGYQLRCE